MSNEQLKEEIMQDILDGLEISLEVENPYYDSYERFRVNLYHDGKLITSDYIPNKQLGKGE